jgi:hypothetical protein
MKEAMQAALLEHGSIRGAALALGMPKSTFADRARQWHLSTARPARGRRRTVTAPVSGANRAGAEGGDVEAQDADSPAERGQLGDVAANAAVAGAYVKDADDVDELVTGGLASLESSPVEPCSGAPEPVSPESSSGTAQRLVSLESSSSALGDTVGLDEPPAAEAWIDETAG